MNKGFNKNEEAFKNDDVEFLGTLGKWHEYAKKNRQKFDWAWYIYDNYYRGNHYIQFNRRTNTIVTPPRPKGQIRLTINKIVSICRAIRNFATSYRPRWSVVADSTSEDSVNNSRKSADTLDYYYDLLEIPKLVKGLALYLIKYGTGFFQYGWNDETIGLDNQPGECEVWIRDPFDVYLDPVGMETGNLQNCRFIDIATSVPIQDIVNNPNYKKLDIEDISGDTKRAQSEFKQSLIASQYSSSTESDSELKTKILHETLYKKRVKDKKEKKDDPDTYHTEGWVASWIEGHLLRNEITEFTKYNLIAIASDDNPNEIYGEGYIKNLVSINKALNRLESQVLEYNNLVNRGRLIVDKDSGVSKITNETGEIIEKNPGSDVREMNHQGLAPDLNQQINRLNDYMKEISGVADAFMGKVPEGIKSGVALESLRAQTANNLQDLKDNVEKGLAELGEGILEMLANKVIVPRQMQKKGKDGKPEYFKIKGQVGVKPNEELPNDTYIIGNQNKVKVVIGSDLAYTREGRITRLDKLLETGVIDQQTYLEHLEFGDVDEIAKRSKQEKFDNAMLANIEKNGMAGQPGQMPQGMPAQGGKMPAQQPAQQPQGTTEGQPQQDSWTKLAEDENLAMLQGKIIPSTKDAPKEHTAIHIAFSQSDDAQGNEALLTILLEHIKGEEKEQMTIAGVNMEVQNE